MPPVNHLISEKGDFQTLYVPEQTKGFCNLMNSLQVLQGLCMHHGFHFNLDGTHNSGLCPFSESREGV